MITGADIDAELVRRGQKPGTGIVRTGEMTGHVSKERVAIVRDLEARKRQADGMVGRIAHNGKTYELSHEIHGSLVKQYEARFGAGSYAIAEESIVADAEKGKSDVFSATYFENGREHAKLMFSIPALSETLASGKRLGAQNATQDASRKKCNQCGAVLSSAGCKTCGGIPAQARLSQAAATLVVNTQKPAPAKPLSGLARTRAAFEAKLRKPNQHNRR